MPRDGVRSAIRMHCGPRHTHDHSDCAACRRTSLGLVSSVQRALDHQIPTEVRRRRPTGQNHYDGHRGHSGSFAHRRRYSADVSRETTEASGHEVLVPMHGNVWPMDDSIDSALQVRINRYERLFDCTYSRQRSLVCSLEWGRRLATCLPENKHYCIPVLFEAVVLGAVGRPTGGATHDDVGQRAGGRRPPVK